ncbi:MAG: hypothetical protein RSB76_01315 [Clostridia bacterium]
MFKELKDLYKEKKVEKLYNENLSKYHNGEFREIIYAQKDAIRLITKYFGNMESFLRHLNEAAIDFPVCLEEKKGAILCQSIDKDHLIIFAKLSNDEISPVLFPYCS